MALSNLFPSIETWAASRASGSAPSLARQCVVDTAKRTGPAVPTYAFYWTLYCIVSGLWESSRTMATLNLALLLVVAGCRALVHANLDRLMRHGADLANLLVSGGSLAAGVHWGVLTALSMASPGPDAGWWLTFAISAAVAAGGSLSVAINPALRLAYPVAIYGPVAIGALVLPVAHRAILLTMISMAVLYTWRSSRVVSEDYWDAVQSRLAAEEHARTMEAVSVTDALTGLLNRLGLERALQSEWTRAKQQQGSLAVLMIDIDHFKKINDSFGHPFGDECLRAMASCLRAGMRSSADAVGRMGGEEFVAALPGANLAGAVATAERLLQHVRAMTVASGDTAVKFTCSIGVAIARPMTDAGFEQVLKRADDALYVAKRTGRDRVVPEA